MIIMRARPSPFEVMFMVAALLGGAAILLLRQHLGTGSATGQLPVVVTIIFGIGLMIGAGTVLVGLALRTLWGTLLERAGLSVLALLMLVYSALTLDAYGLRAAVSALFFVSLAAACAWRFSQIGGELHEVETSLTEDVTRPSGTTDARE